jgi:hypothetical protein
MVVVHCRNDDDKNCDLLLFVKDLRTSNRFEQRIGFILIQKELVEFFTNEDFGKSEFIFRENVCLIGTAHQGGLFKSVGSCRRPIWQDPEI